MIWRSWSQGVPRPPSVGWVKLSLLVALSLLVMACAPGPVPSVTSAASHNSTKTAIPAATRTTADALSHIHNASPRFIPLFASVTFTVDTTYDQATAIVRGHVYPWTCDEPRSNEPPPPAEQQSNFAAWHGLLMSYPAWDELERIASSPQVISVEGTALYPCP